MFPCVSLNAGMRGCEEKVILQPVVNKTVQCLSSEGFLLPEHGALCWVAVTRSLQLHPHGQRAAACGANHARQENPAGKLNTERITIAGLCGCKGMCFAVGRLYRDK